MAAIEAVARIIGLHGQSMTLKRAGELDLAIKAKRVPGSTEDIGNGQQQQNFRVKMRTTELDASAWAVKAPAFGDFLVIDGRTRSVMDAIPLKDGDTILAWQLEVAG